MLIACGFGNSARLYDLTLGSGDVEEVGKVVDECIVMICVDTGEQEVDLLTELVFRDVIVPGALI